MAYGFCFRHFRRDAVSSSAAGNPVNLQVIPGAVPHDRNGVPASPDIITVIRHGVPAGSPTVPFPADISPVQWWSVTLHHDAPPAIPNSVHDQRKRPGNLPESDTLVLNIPCKTPGSILPEQDDAPDCRTTILQDHDSRSAQRNSLPLAPDSLQEQLSSVLKPLFGTKMAKFHEVLKRMVYRLKLPAQTFLLYGMPLDGKTPEFGTQVETFEFIDQFVNGDIESGKLRNPRIACPTVEEIKEKKDIAKKEYDDVIVADRAYAAVEKELSGLRLTADENIQDVIADLRRSLRKLTPPAQRRIMMSYGARFKFLPGEPEELPEEAASVEKEPVAAGA